MTVIAVGGCRYERYENSIQHSVMEHNWQSFGENFTHLLIIMSGFPKESLT